MRWLELNAEGVVVNVIVWDGVSPYQPPPGGQLLACSEHDGVRVGWRLVSGEWVAPSTE